MKKEKICINHQCEICGKKLYPQWSNWITIPIFLFLMGLMFLTIHIQTKRMEKIQSEPDCYKKVFYITSGEGALKEQFYKVWEAECPSLK